MSVLPKYVYTGTSSRYLPNIRFVFITLPLPHSSNRFAITYTYERTYIRVCVCVFCVHFRMCVCVCERTHVSECVSAMHDTVRSTHISWENLCAIEICAESVWLTRVQRTCATYACLPIPAIRMARCCTHAAMAIAYLNH